VSDHFDPQPLIGALMTRLTLSVHPPMATFPTKRSALSGAVADAVAFRCDHHDGWHADMNHRIETMQYPTSKPEGTRK
jgi:hypothetical protein